jgi:hypothetical protein
MKAALYIALLCAGMASAAPGGKSGKASAPFSAASSAPAAGGRSSGGAVHRAGTAALYVDPRRAPEMTPERKVEELDCTKPVDLAAGGNLKCK